MNKYFILFTILCAACAPGPCDDEEGLRTVPVTNRRGVVPDHGDGLPGIGSGPR